MQPDGLGQPRRFFALVVITIATVITAVGGMMVNLALPSLSRDFAVEPAHIVWVVNVYQVVIAICLFPLGALGERFGHKTIYFWGMLLFTVGSALCAEASGFATLIAARALQGIGAAGIMSVNIALVRFIFPRRLIGRGIGYNTLIVALSTTAGPTLGSLILSVAPWPWLFIVNIPLGVIGTVLAAAALPPSPRSSRAHDWAGAGLIALAVGLPILAVDGIGRGDAIPLLAVQFVLGILFLVLLVRHQLARPEPMLPLDLLRTPIIRLSAATSSCSYIVQGLSFVALPFYFHDSLGLDLLDVGLLMTPWPLAVAVASPISGRLSDRYSAGALGTLGLALLALGMALLALLPAAPAHWDILWRMSLCGLGFGLFQTPNSRAIIMHAPANRSGGASAIQAGSRLLGQALGAALVATIFGSLPQLGPIGAIYLGALFAGLACLVSSLRLDWRKTT